MNLVYVGIDNPLSISVFGYKCKEIFIKTKDAKLTNTQCGKYTIRPEHQGTVTFTVYSVLDGVENIIDTIRFRAVYIPEPSTGYKNVSRNFSILDLRKEHELSKAFLGYDYTDSLKIISFNYLLVRDTTFITSGANEGAKFNKKLLESIKQLLPDDKIIFEKIIVEDRELRLHKLNSVALKLEI